MQKQLHPSLALSVEAATDDDGSLLGKDASDLQENIIIGDSKISGSLKYVTGYTGFSGTAAEQSGNYIALKCEATSGASISIEIIGGYSGPVTLDPDGLWVGKIANNQQSIKIVATKNGVSDTRILTLQSLVLQSA